MYTYYNNTQRESDYQFESQASWERLQRSQLEGKKGGEGDGKVK